MTPECIPCLLGRVLFEAELCAPRRAAAAMRDGLAILHESYVPGANSAEVATKVHRRVYDVLGCEDPYASLKERSDEGAASLHSPVRRPPGGRRAGGHRWQRHGLRHSGT